LTAIEVTFTACAACVSYVKTAGLVIDNVKKATVNEAANALFSILSF